MTGIDRAALIDAAARGGTVHHCPGTSVEVIHSEDRCEACNRILDCCGNCPKCGPR